MGATNHPIQNRLCALIVKKEITVQPLAVDAKGRKRLGKIIEFVAGLLAGKDDTRHGVPYIPKNRYQKVARIRWLDTEERTRLLQALPLQPLYLRLAVGIAISTAARKSAILELQKHQIKWGEGQIDFHAPSDGKKRKARRVCDITGMVQPRLREAFDASQTGYIKDKNGNAV